MANRKSYHERHMGNQATCKPTETEQAQQQETLVHFKSILHFTRYTVHGNKQELNEMMGGPSKNILRFE